MFYIRHNDAIYRHRLVFMLYAYWYVKKLRSIGREYAARRLPASPPIYSLVGLKTQKMSLSIIKCIGDELISDKSIFGFHKFCKKSR